jgi:hypothetical protein
LVVFSSYLHSVFPAFADDLIDPTTPSDAAPHGDVEGDCLDYGNLDFVKYAESYGAHGHRIASTAELLTTLTVCLDTKGVHLIEIPVDYSGNQDLLEKELVCPE